MTHQEIIKATDHFLKCKMDSDKELHSMFNEVINENLGSALLDVNGVIDEVFEAIDEDFVEDKYGDYPKLKLKELENILSQVI